eukprot:1140598-Pelagomonas_calceolata.AAC.2
MLYATDLSFTSNKADQTQCMLNRLLPYARRKRLTVNIAESEVVHFNSHIAAAAADCVVPTFHAGCVRVRHFVSDHELVHRLHTLLWLTKIYINIASMYGSQIWGTSYMKERAEIGCLLRIGRLCFSKRMLRVKGSTCN